ncbi:MAG: serine hydrolase [Candidatus Binatia bacterium]|nr:serine hydrolase [Candidatus Binatia bacterium]
MRRITRRTICVSAAVASATALLAGGVGAYPLDGYPNSGITRIEGFRLAQRNSGGKVLPPGGDLTTDKIVLSLQHKPNFQIPAPDPQLNQMLRDELGSDVGGYGVALLDVSDPDRPRYAEVNPDAMMNAGSVGKVLLALGMFQTLADIEPDIRKRRDMLKETVVVTDEFIRTDSHEVPVFHIGGKKVRRRPIAEGEQMTLYTLLDHMMSPSSNAAASMVGREAVLMKHFGSGYPKSHEASRAYLNSAGKGQLSGELKAVLQEPVGRNGLNRGKLRQGSLFTREGKKRLPGTSSYASARSLMEFLVAMEMGELVDPWSSKEIKKLLYVTDRRIRYASSPALRNSAVYFKSGSLYKCRPERGHVCEKYHGNVWNFLASIAVVEEPERNPPMRYMVVVLSNVLRKNAAEEHERLGTRIQQMMQQLHPLRTTQVAQ